MRRRERKGRRERLEMDCTMSFPFSAFSATSAFRSLFWMLLERVEKTLWTVGNAVRSSHFSGVFAP